MVGPAFGGLLFTLHPLLPISVVVLIYSCVFLAVWQFYRSTIIHHKPPVRQPNMTDRQKSGEENEKHENETDNKKELNHSQSNTTLSSEDDSDVDLTQLAKTAAARADQTGTVAKSPVSVADHLLLNDCQTTSGNLREKKEL